MLIKTLLDLERYISIHRAALGFDPSAVEIEPESFDRIVHEDMYLMPKLRDGWFRYKDVLIARGKK